MSVFVKPFMQIVEDCKLEMRDNSSEASVENKYKRRVNDIYVRDIPSRFEWDWLRSVSTLILKAKYSTGTVLATNASANLVGTDTVWTAAMTGMKFTVPSTNEIYTFTRTGATTGTISPVYQGATASGLTYVIFEYIYALASDYGRYTTEPGFYYDYSTGRTQLKWQDDTDFRKYFTTQPSQFPTYFADYGVKSSAGYQQVRIMPPVDTARIISYEYIKALPEMSEFTTGTATTTLSGTSVTTSSDYSSKISAGQYFRIDADGTWSRISSVSTTTLVLDDAYPSANNTATYTVCDAPDMPHTLHEALFYGACWLTAKEQGDKTSIQYYLSAYQGAIGMDMARKNRKRYGRQYMRRPVSR